MSEISFVIRNACIVDGSGAPSFQGDLAVAGDRIVQMGKVDGRGAVEYDAKGHVLAPGFIDVHTHYDPQLCWDRRATPSPEHGVTSLIAGNCSVSLAPVRPADHGLVIKLFGAVEDMESRQLTSTIPFSWEKFGEYLDYLKDGLGPNVGMLLGHSNLRFYVMGAQAQERAATDAEIKQMCDVMREALRAGAMGLSFTYVHLDDTGRDLPSTFSDRREILALMQVMAEEKRGFVEAAPPFLKGLQPVLDYIDFMGELALETGVMCTLSPISQTVSDSDRWSRLLMRFDAWRARNAPLYAQTQARPNDQIFNLSMGSVLLSKLTHFRAIFEMGVEDRIRALSDPKVVAGIESDEPHMPPTVGKYKVKRVISQNNKRYVGRSLESIAKREKKTVLRTIIDIALADGLKTDFESAGLNHADTIIVGALLSHPNIFIGSADAGAHITQFAGAGDTSYIFEKFVRQEKLMTLERAVQRLTSDLAKGFNIKDRGELAVGKFADLVIFDPETIERGAETWVEDVPDGDGRYVRRPQGIDKVFVNGQLLVDGGQYTKATPGRII